MLKQKIPACSGKSLATDAARMLYRHQADHCFDDRLKHGGVSHAAIDQALERLVPALKSIQARTHTASAIFDLYAASDDLAFIEAHAAKIRKRFGHVVVVGSGGSGLSGRVLASIKPWSTPGLHFLENIDPVLTEALLAHLDMADTCFIFISKSGETVETLAQFFTLFDYAKKTLGDKTSEHFIVISMATDNPLRRAAHARGVQTLDYEKQIGGRFSVLALAGLLPGAIAGLNISALRQGAASLITALDHAKHPRDLAPAQGAALQYAFAQRGASISVMMPYCERLRGFAYWYRQSWAESLGKDGKGTTPIPGVGTSDQHSQLQLYLAGPRDKLFHLIFLKRQGTGLRLEEDGPLKGKTMGDIMAAEQKATYETLIRNGCPVRLFELDELKEQQMGALLAHFTLEILFMAELLGVNPLDQPAVEESKQLTRDYLAKTS